MCVRLCLYIMFIYHVLVQSCLRGPGRVEHRWANTSTQPQIDSQRINVLWCSIHSWGIRSWGFIHPLALSGSTNFQRLGRTILQTRPRGTIVATLCWVYNALKKRKIPFNKLWIFQDWSWDCPNTINVIWAAWGVFGRIDMTGWYRIDMAGWYCNW